MQRLTEIINSLDKKPISKYSSLYGQYKKDDITYYIKDINGNYIKYCCIEIKIPTKLLFQNWTYNKADIIPACSYILRQFSSTTHVANQEMEQSESNIAKGYFIIYNISQKVIKNNIIDINKDVVTISLDIKLPTNKSTYDKNNDNKISSSQSKKNGVISSHALKILLCKNMISLVSNFINNFDEPNFFKSVQLYQNQEFIRKYLKENDYISFIGNNSILPRRGKTDYRVIKGVFPFTSPKSLEIEIQLPNGNKIIGMGIKKGITIIIGDAYNGKSTILFSIYSGIYNHCLGDGREYVITEKSALNITAEDGRSIKSVDLSFFLTKLPTKNINVTNFLTDCASGSTSQAAAISEALEMNCKLMLFDEDRSANNFMYKDEIMKKIINDVSTTPLLDSAQFFLDKFDVSFIIVTGASSEYLKIADSVILVDKFIVKEINNYKDLVPNKLIQKDELYNKIVKKERVIDFKNLIDINKSRNFSILDSETIKYGIEKIKITNIIPHCTNGQLCFICSFLYYVSTFTGFNRSKLINLINTIYSDINENINIIKINTIPGLSHLEYVRKEDMICVINRIRYVNIT